MLTKKTTPATGAAELVCCLQRVSDKKTACPAPGRASSAHKAISHQQHEYTRGRCLIIICCHSHSYCVTPVDTVTLLLPKHHAIWACASAHIPIQMDGTKLCAADSKGRVAMLPSGCTAHGCVCVQVPASSLGSAGRPGVLVVHPLWHTCAASAQLGVLSPTTASRGCDSRGALHTELNLLLGHGRHHPALESLLHTLTKGVSIRHAVLLCF